MAKPQRFGSILNHSLVSLGIKSPMKVYGLWGAWREVLGDSVAANTRPAAVRNRILFVEASHPAWIQQLQFLKPVLLEKINAFLGERLIDDVRFRVGTMPQGPAVAPEAGWSSEQLSPGTVARIEDQLQNVADEEMRRLLRGVLTNAAKVEQYRRTRGGKG